MRTSRFEEEQRVVRNKKIHSPFILSNSSKLVTPLYQSKRKNFLPSGKTFSSSGRPLVSLQTRVYRLHPTSLSLEKSPSLTINND